MRAHYNGPWTESSDGVNLIGLSTPRQDAGRIASGTSIRAADRNVLLPRKQDVNLDVLICTYNRSALLRKTLDSLFRAPRPEGLRVRVYIVDNNSPDDTASVIRNLQAESPLPLHYVFEKKQGLSQARNAGLTASDGDIIGIIDDDEEVEEHWFEVIARELKDPTIHYIGGPYLANWQAPAPDWLPPGYPGVIGVMPPKHRGRFGPDHPGMLNGGNAAIRRTVFDQVGLYSTRLGRTAKGLLSEEDAEFFRRVLAAGISGMYVPDFAIFHHIPADRLTRKYHRSWAYWRAVSQGVLDREQREPVKYLFGVPRHRIGRAIRGLLTMPAHRFGKNGKARAFADELAVWDLAGFLHGKHFFNPESAEASQAPKTA